MKRMILLAALGLSACVTKPTDPVLAAANYSGVDYLALAECTYATLPPVLANSQFTPLPSMNEARIVVGSGIEVGTIWTFRPAPGGAMLETRSSLIGDQAGLIQPYADACAAKMGQGS
jgi:hypothetical protein